MIDREPGSSSHIPFVERTVAPDGLDEILQGFDAEVTAGHTTYTDQIGDLKAASASVETPLAPGTEAFKRQFDAELAAFRSLKNLIADISPKSSPEPQPEPAVASPLETDHSEPKTTDPTPIGAVATRVAAEPIPQPVETSEPTPKPVTPVEAAPAVVATPTPETQKQPDTRETFAEQVAPHELLRKPNSNHPVDPAYLERHTKARHMFVEALTDGSLYSSVDHFTEVLQQAHQEIVPSRKQKDQSEGPFRPAGKLVEHNKKFAREVVEIAKQYEDPYARQFDQPDRRSVSIVKLPGIDQQSRPVDIAAKNGRYTFEFPIGEAVPQYMQRVAQLGQGIQAELAKSQPDTRRAIGLIGAQYQYAATAQPFMHNSNPTIMNLVNAQLKMLGLNGITHGIMDHAARRLQPNAFVQYFADRVNGKIE